MSTPYGPAGVEFHEAVHADYTLGPSEEAALVNACRVIDTLADLDAAIAETGVVTASGRPSPLLAERRQQHAILVRLLGLLALPPGEDEDDEEEPAPGSSATSRAARVAARARWRQQRGR